MQLKNLDTGVALPLSGDLFWSDEYVWSPTVTNAFYLITGTSLIQSVTRQAGRPIILVGAPDMAWVAHVVVEQLRVWAVILVGGNTGRLELTFTGGHAFTVAFRHTETAIETGSALDISARSSNDFYRLILRFLEIT